MIKPCTTGIQSIADQNRWASESVMADFRSSAIAAGGADSVERPVLCRLPTLRCHGAGRAASFSGECVLCARCCLMTWASDLTAFISNCSRSISNDEDLNLDHCTHSISNDITIGAANLNGSALIKNANNGTRACHASESILRLADGKN